MTSGHISQVYKLNCYQSFKIQCVSVISCYKTLLYLIKIDLLPEFKHTFIAHLMEID